MKTKEGGVMDINKEREAFEKSIAANIENFCDAAFDGKYYVMRNNSRLKQRDKEFLILSLNRSWSAWQAAKAQAVPEGYVLVPREMHWHKADELACLEWGRHVGLFCSENRDMTATQVEEFRLRWCKNKAYQIMSEYKGMIEAQVQPL